MTYTIRPYQASDFESVYALWQTTLGASWLLSPDFLKRMISGAVPYQEGDNFIAEQNGQPVGFVASQTHAAGKSAGIPLLMVRPENQRHGIGTALHAAAIDHLRRKAVTAINVGVGGAEYFWCGVPLNASGAIEFFQACGWNLAYPNYDLTRDLVDYQTPPGTLERVAHIDIRLTTPAEAPAVQAFERDHFDYWAEFFDKTAGEGRYSEILAAWDGSTVVGSLLLEQPSAQAFNPGAVWHKILGDDMGSIGAVGVAESHREQGIGLALVARASEILQERGVRQCVIGWTDLLSFYGRLGYRVWRSYLIADALES